MRNKTMAIALSAILLLSSTATVNLSVSADACKVITLGEDLSDEQKETVLKFFNATESEAQIITVNNAEEHELLDGVVDSSVIGTHTLSCCYINPTTEGGIKVKTANLNWVTDAMLANALVTAGVENCEIVATAPFEVSGTGALVGILKAYETASESTLEEDKKTSATEELVLSAELTDDNTEEDVLKFMNDLKTQAVKGTLGDDSLEKTATKYGITLGEDIKAQLQEWLDTFKTLSYDIEQFTDSVNNLNATLTDLSETVTTSSKGFFQKIADWFKKLIAWIQGKEYVDDVVKIKDTTSDFFNQIDTSVFSFDDDEATVGDSE